MPSLRLVPVISVISLGIGAWLGTRYERKQQLNEIIERDSFVNRISDTTSKLINSINRSPTIKDIGDRLDDLKNNHDNASEDVNALFHRFIPSLDASAIMVPTKPLNPPVPRDIRKFNAMTRLGLPGSPSNIRTYDEFILAYDNRTRNPSWVFEHLTKEDVKRREDVKRDNITFVDDKTIHEYYRSQNADYSRSGYDRGNVDDSLMSYSPGDSSGHMAAAANHRKNMPAMTQTFLLTNVCPQLCVMATSKLVVVKLVSFTKPRPLKVGVGFNRDAWNLLEKTVRSMTNKFRNVYVCTGPLYLPSRQANGKLMVSYEVIGDRQVAVPTHFFKVALGERDDGGFELRSYIMPNQAIDVKDTADLVNYLVPIDIIERSSGLLMFDKLTSSSKVSSTQPLLA